MLPSPSIHFVFPTILFLKLCLEITQKYCHRNQVLILSRKECIWKLNAIGFLSLPLFLCFTLSYAMAKKM